MGVSLIIIFLVLAFIAAGVMLYRTLGKGKRNETSPGAGSRPDSGPHGSTGRNNG
ncbi:hypothetical protein [Fibrisoma montanum]|uniref:hypothetical protein n=1 Tax=Fibrisoma montanum TaxID=2305895 RepID=UPI0013149EF3|nr:hypothetical protein [Fibrisoma montanum]